MAALNIAFEAPDNSRVGRPSTARPIDLVYLAAQTAGNKVLEAEVLQVFARQARIALQELSRNDAEGRKAAAHRLKGRRHSPMAVASSPGGGSPSGRQASGKAPTPAADFLDAARQLPPGTCAWNCG